MKYFIIIFILNSCSNSNVGRVRIVDANGRPAKINKIIPKFNEEQLKKQKDAFNNNLTVSDVNKFRQNYNELPQNNSKNNSTQAFSFDQNIVVPFNNNYPSDIFADRITNYNYIHDNKVVQETPIKESKNKADNKLNEIVEYDTIDDNFQNKNKQTVIYSKKKNDVEPLEKTKINKTKSKAIPSNNNIKSSNNDFKTTLSGNIYIQIGIYTEKKNADIIYNKYKKINEGSIETYNNKGIKNYKVLLGPFTDRKVAEKNLEKVIKTGHYDVYITNKK